MKLPAAFPGTTGMSLLPEIAKGANSYDQYFDQYIRYVRIADIAFDQYQPV